MAATAAVFNRQGRVLAIGIISRHCLRKRNRILRCDLFNTATIIYKTEIDPQVRASLIQWVADKDSEATKHVTFRRLR